MTHPPRPAHTKIDVGGITHYACVVHVDKVIRHAERLARDVQTVHASERDSSTVWCSFCEQETR